MHHTTLSRRTLLKSALLTASGASLLPSLAFATQPTQTEILQTALVPCAEQMEPEFLNPEKPEVKARLLANENPYGPSAKAKEAIVQALEQSFMYPMKSMKALIELIAETEKVSPEHILLGAGSTEILLAAFLGYGSKGNFVVADPGYISRIEELDLVKVPLTKDYAHDLDAMAGQVNEDTSMVYICNPNNPTGTLLEPTALKQFCKEVSAKVPVMVDEAYIDYTSAPQQNTMMDCVREGQNVIVVRTFSKLHAFAGLRVGYCIAQPETIKTLKKTKSPNSLSLASIEGAIASYQDTAFPEMVLSKTQEAKDFVYNVLKEHKFSYIPSHTNFVLFPLRMKGKTFLDKMSDEGVQVRRWEFERQHWCRVSLGKMEDMKTFAAAFSKVVS